MSVTLSCFDGDKSERVLCCAVQTDLLPDHGGPRDDAGDAMAALPHYHHICDI